MNMTADREALVRLLAEEPLRIRGADFQSEHRPVTDYIDKLQGALRSIILAAQGGGQPPDRETLVKRLQHASTVLKVSPRAADLQAVSYIIDDAIAALSAQGGEQTAEVEVIDPYAMDLVREHGHAMTNSEIVQRFLPKRKLATADTVSVPIPESQMKNGYFGLTLCFGSTSTRDKAHDMLAAAKEGK